MLCKDKSCHRDLGSGLQTRRYISRTGKVMSTFVALCSACGKTTFKSYRDDSCEVVLTRCPTCGNISSIIKERR